MAIGSLTWPLGDDQEIFTWIGDVILKGGVPYRDAWDVKGPLTYYLYAFAVGLFGYNEWAIRLLDLPITLILCWCLRRVTLKLYDGDHFASRCAVVFFLFSYYGWWLSAPAQPDGWAAETILISVLLLMQQSSNLRMVAIGGLLAVATLLKPLYLAYLPIPLLYVATQHARRSNRLWLCACCIVTVGITLLISFAMLFIVSHGLNDFFNIVRFLIFSYLPKHRSLNEIVAVARLLWSLGLIAPMLLAPLGIKLMYNIGKERQANLMGGWLLCAIACVIVQGKYFEYHWIPVVVPLAPLLGGALRHVYNTSLRSDSPGVVARILPLLVLLIALAPVSWRALVHNYQLPGYLIGNISRERYVKHLTAEYPWNYWAMERVSAYIAHHSVSSDRVVVWGWDPVINILSNRQSPTRFAYSLPLVVSGPLQTMYRNIFISDISRSTPCYVVVDMTNPWPHVNRSGLDTLNEFPEFNKLLATNYSRVLNIDQFKLLKENHCDSGK